MEDPNELRTKLGSGLFCAVMVAMTHQLQVNIRTLLHRFGSPDRSINPIDLAMACKSLGLKVKKTRVKQDRMLSMPPNTIVQLKDERWATVLQSNRNNTGNELFVLLPDENRPTPMGSEALWALMSGTVLFVTARKSAVEASLEGFGLLWFLTEVLRHRMVFALVLFVSLWIHVLGFASPLYFQNVMDKVLVHGNINTLQTLSIGLAGVFVVELFLRMGRNYLLNHTACKIDVQLSSKLFRHMLGLPLNYFENRRVGAIIARIQELESVRQFLTSTPTSVLLDLMFVLLYVVVLFYYSPLLTWGVLGSFVLYGVFAASISRPLRRYLRERFQRGAENQAFLVESLSGMASIKSGTAEAHTEKSWEDRLAIYVSIAFKSVQLAACGSDVISFIRSFMMLFIIAFGVSLVFAGDLTIGQLIAFNMLAARAADPVVRLSQMWQEYQQFGVSLAKIGELLEEKREHTEGLMGNLGDMRGEIEFRDVRYCYPLKRINVLDGISFKVRPGQRIGIVGESGSGKSTLVRLLLKHNPLGEGQGKVLIDGHDLTLVSPEWVRSQTGVVLQETELLNATIAQNIAYDRPDAPMEQIIEAAKLAGAHDFIVEGEKGYQTELLERGKNLSGGQRQRIAIARALIRHPRILVFDEATSALDFETEAIVQRNLAEIAKGRTMLITSHRLSVIVVQSDQHPVLPEHRQRGVLPPMPNVTTIGCTPAGTDAATRMGTDPDPSVTTTSQGRTCAW